MSPQETAPTTRTKLLDAAQELMLSKGYGATSLEGICAAAGVTKGSFFHYFASKQELGRIVLERFAEGQAAAIGKACAGIDDPLERIYAAIEFVSESSRAPDMKGCLLGTVGQEVAETQPALREVIGQNFAGFARGLSGDFVQAKALHAPNREFDPALLGDYFLSVLQGSMLLLRATGDRDVVHRNLALFRSYLKDLYGA